MTDIDYNERVRLIRGQEGPKEMSLADAVRTVMSWPDVGDRMDAEILRDGEPLMTSSQIKAVFDRSDFPISN